MRYRIDVIASRVDDVVRSAGGWLFDRVMAGWDVNLLCAEPCRVRALQILGVGTQPIEPMFDSVTNRPTAQAIAVAAEAFNANARIRENVIAALERGRTEVTLWGDAWPPEFHRRAEPVQHRLSSAARTFKAYALSAAALPATAISETEVFRSACRWHPAHEPHLVRLGPAHPLCASWSPVPETSARPLGM